MKAGATYESTAALVRSASGGQTPQMEENRNNKWVYFSADNAADEWVAGGLLRREFPNLKFDLPDTTHSLQLALMNGIKGDPEVEKIQGIFLLDKQATGWDTSQLLELVEAFETVSREIRSAAAGRRAVRAPTLRLGTAADVESIQALWQDSNPIALLVHCPGARG